MNQISLIPVTLLLLPALLCAADTASIPAAVTPPPPAREFRAAWIAVVASNQDWPSEPGLPVAQQKAELISLLDRAAQLHFNAVILQIRPSCDALYASPFEPWSERLTGKMGMAPQPFYDPLAFAIQEAHKRGLQLHAWFNPFRALHPLSKSFVAPNHITKTHPELVREYNAQYWLDPGEPAVREYVQRVVLDVVRRYDVDGVTFDDYFYPYPVKNALRRELDYPDDASWQKYGLKTELPRDDWRRQNVNQFVQGVYQAIKAAKPQVQFGISPFGIWRPQNPPMVKKGLDAYAKIYADARLWLASGWVDYLAPQLYWPIASPEESFPVLFNWWRAQNLKGRHVYAGLDDAATDKTFSTDEIARQIRAVRTQTSNSGEIHYHLRSVTDNPALAAAIRTLYAQPALVPASPWIASTPPLKPKLTVGTGNNSAHVRWENSHVGSARNWLLQARTGGIWTTQVFPGGQTDFYFNNSPDAISLCAVDRLGNLSEPAVWLPKKYAPPDTSRGAERMKK